MGCNASIARPGCYIQGAGTVHFGDYVRLAPNVGILSANHDLYDQRKYNAAPIVIGDYSWIGMNSIVTAGVVLGQARANIKFQTSRLGGYWQFLFIHCKYHQFYDPESIFRQRRLRNLQTGDVCV